MAMAAGEQRRREDEEKLKKAAQNTLEKYRSLYHTDNDATLFLIAVKKKNINLADSLIRLGRIRDVNIRGLGGVTPLHEAAYQIDEAMVRGLIQHGADVNAVDDYTRTPLDVVFTRDPRRSQAIIDLLRDADARTGAELGK